MNYLAVRNEIIGTRFDSSQDANVKNWVTQAYAWVWNAAKWQFKKVASANLAITAGNDSPTLATDFGDRLEIYDQYGDPLLFLDPDLFDQLYKYDKLNGATQQPEAFKLVNRQPVLGPTPNVTTTFTYSYERRVCAFQSNGTTVVVGGMSSDTDIPFWDAAHHMVLVHKGAEIGGGVESDNSAILWSQLARDALDSMIEELAIVRKPVRQYGRVDW